MMAQKILFLHGFFASGACVPALALKDYFNGKATVLTPDLPLHPREALDFIRRLCEQEKPDILLGNPYFEMTRFLIERIGSHEYKSPRANGNQQLVIDLALIDEFAGLQQHQWDYCQTASQKNIWGIFGENDHLAHFEPLFLKHYKYAYHFPGGHTPTAEEVRTYYAPLAEKLLGV